jgi:hypothetical protein
LNKPTTLLVSLYNQVKSSQNKPAQQYEIKLPREPEQEEVKDEKEKHHCHYHGKSQLKAEKSSASAKLDMSFVSQIYFSWDLCFMACLVSGPYNGIVIFEIKKLRCLHSQIWFTSGTPLDMEMRKTTSKYEKPIFNQIVTRISFSYNYSNMICATGPNRYFCFYKFKFERSGEEPTKILDEDPAIKRMREFMDSKSTITSHCWSEVHDTSICAEKDTDGRILVICSDKGHLCAAKLESAQASDTEQPILMMQHFASKSFCDVTMTQTYLVAATFNAEFMFFELDNAGKGLIEVRKAWNLLDSQNFDTLSNPTLSVRGMRSMLDSKQQ